MANTDLVKVEKYAAMQQDLDELVTTIRANVGNQQLSEFDLDRIKIPTGAGKAWTVPTLEGDTITQELQGVIVHWKDTRAYWKVPFDQSGGGGPPDCSSPDAELASGDPSPGRAPADEQSGLLVCARCTNSQFGSDPRDESNAQACNHIRQLFLLTPEDLIPLVVSLPPTSVRPSMQYFLRLSRKGIPYYGVVTRIGLEQDQSGTGIKFSKATFSMAAQLEGEQAERVRLYAEQMRPAFDRAQIQSADDFVATPAA